MEKNQVYVNRADTPMRFFTFVKVGLVLGLLSRVRNLVSMFPLSLNGYTGVIAFITVAGIVLCVVSLVGYFNMAWYGPLAFMGLWVLLILQYIYIIVFAKLNHLNDLPISEYVMTSIGACVCLRLIWVYFRKRRLLFSPPPKGQQKSGGTAEENNED